MKETWKDVKDWEGFYEISSEGRVRRKAKLCRSYFHPQLGNLFLILQANGRKKHARIHRLVAEAFLPNPNNLPIVDHIDRNKLNNHVTNLRWVTPLQSVLNRGKTKHEKTSKYKGVTRTRHGTWAAYSSVNDASIHLGTFKDETEAALAYDFFMLAEYPNEPMPLNFNSAL